MEINVYFKNVGQGDTIIFDWKENKNDLPKFGLIDCNLINGDIFPVRKHIQDFGITEFELVILSHPHSDHFSGFPKLFDYCQTNNVKINNFLHTSQFSPKWLSSLLGHSITKSEHQVLSLKSVKSKYQKKRLNEVYQRLIKEEIGSHAGFVKRVQSCNNMPISLTNDIKLQFLSPTNSELTEYVNNHLFVDGDHIYSSNFDSENNPMANLLSSFIQIYSLKYKWQFFLSSDCTFETLQRLVDENNKSPTFDNLKLLFAQIPHHGSQNNHLPGFWDIPERAKLTPLIISVGDGYGHPAIEVVRHFDQTDGFTVHATNCVGGFRKYYYGTQSDNEHVQMPGDDIIAMPGFNNSFDQHNFFPERNSAPPCCEKHIRIEMKKGLMVCRVLPVEIL